MDSWFCITYLYKSYRRLYFPVCISFRGHCDMIDDVWKFFISNANWVSVSTVETTIMNLNFRRFKPNNRRMKNPFQNLDQITYLSRLVDPIWCWKFNLNILKVLTFQVFYLEFCMKSTFFYFYILLSLAYILGKYLIRIIDNINSRFRPNENIKPQIRFSNNVSFHFFPSFR